ncbi:MAG: CcmD family protein [candidate division Zixibacteria bacterium HGW-Zixibacteria-1]|nr:MAG: CcmD family protein [candidate division Zixibacteria bacterium HGW-Zixibacteria-1]
MNANYIVMIVVLIIWIGIFLYLMGLDRRIKRIEKKNEG